MKGVTLVYKSTNGKIRLIPPNKYWINRNTPVGEDAELWERMPHGGKRLLDWRRVIDRRTE